MTDTSQAPLDLDQFEGHTPEPWLLQCGPMAGHFQIGLNRLNEDFLLGVGNDEGSYMLFSGIATRADAYLLHAAPRLLAEVRELRAKVAEANARAEAAERQRDELLDAILAQAQRNIASIPHDIWATAVRISKEREAHPVHPVNPVNLVQNEARP